MPLFEFDLRPVEEITPWGLPDKPDLSWFALTLGHFRMPVGGQVLFRYRKDAFPVAPESLDADYQIASIARDILGSVSAGMTRLPPFFERLASDQELLQRLYTTRIEDDSDGESDPNYTAWRWVGERSPWTSYFVECPEFYFVRIEDRIHIRWDNRNRRIDGSEIWEASHGSHVMSEESFISECRDFSHRLLTEMRTRISQIESGDSRPQAAVDIESLRKQHEPWIETFDSYFHPKPPDIPWEQAESAVRKVAAVCQKMVPHQRSGVYF